MKWVEISDYSEPKQFLKDFVAINKKVDRKFGIRYFAKKLNWPASYLSAVISGKRRLTTRRALELGVFCKLDEFDLEKLVLMTIRTQTRDSDLLNHNLERKDIRPTVTLRPTSELSRHIKNFALYEYLKNCKTLPDADDIKRDLRAVSEFPTETIEEMKSGLQNASLIFEESESSNKTVSEQNLLVPKMPINSNTREIISQYLTAANELAKFEDVFSFQAGYAWLNEKQFEQFQKRMASLTQWLVENSDLQKKPQGDRRLYQITHVVLPATN